MASAIAVLLRPDIRSIDGSCTAGTERIAISDLRLLKGNGHPVLFCTSATVTHLQDIPVHRLFYPHNLLDAIQGYSYKGIWGLRFFAGALAFFLVRICELLYVVSFLLITPPRSLYYSFGVPLLAMICPERTLLLFEDLNDRIYYFRLGWLIQWSRIHAVFCSGYLRSEFLKRMNRISSPLFSVLYNYTNEYLFSPGSFAPHTRRVFGYVGTWSYEKGVDLFVRSIRNIPSSLRKRSLWYIAGDIDVWDLPGWAKKDLHILRRQVVNLQSERGVRVSGKIRYEDLPDFYRKLDFLVVPSVYSEPFGNVTIEALSCGVPVIAFRLGATPEIVSDREGFLVHPVSERSLRKALEDQILHTSVRDYQKVSRAARKRVLAKFSTKKRYPNLMALFSPLQ